MPGEENRRGPGHELGWLLVIFYTAVLVRVYPAYGNVFGGEVVSFQGNDAWYHLRLIDHLVANFPHRLTFDPYLVFPGGQEVAVAPGLDYLVATVAWLLGLGSPGPRLVETVAAWTPPILAGLTTFPVFAIGRRLFGPRGGLLAAGLLALQPGQFFLRSVLGFVDHHVAETLFSTATLALLLAALEHADARRSRRAAVLAGLTLAAYLASWGSGSLLVAILGLAFGAELAVSHLFPPRESRLGGVLGWTCAVALVATAPFAAVLPGFTMHAVALAGLLAAIIGLGALERRLRSLDWPRAVFPALVVTLAAATWLAVATLWPELGARIAWNLERFLPSRLGSTVSEVQPLLGAGETPLEEVWHQYRAAFALGAAGLVVFLARLVRPGKAPAGNEDDADEDDAHAGRGHPGDLLFAAWCLSMFAATLGQNRFGYYLDVCLCLLIGQLVCLPRLESHKVARTVLATAVAAAAFVPTWGPVIDIARSPRGPDEGWQRALTWLRHETPEPFGEASAYLARQPPPPGDAYSVMAWWDYGYWISRLGRRPPVANPTQAGADTAARFFTATDPAAALDLLDRAGARYVIANFELALWLPPEGGAYGFFDVMTVWAGEDRSRFFEFAWQSDGKGDFHLVYLFHPDYYRSMAVRLHHFASRAASEAPESWVVALDDAEGSEVPVLAEAVRFDSHAEAKAFLEGKDPKRYRLVGRDPQLPCVPLEAIPGLVQVHQEPSLEVLGPRTVPQIRIFERVGSSAKSSAKSFPAGARLEETTLSPPTAPTE